MDLIPSFTIDHMKMVPGIYVSRVDEVGGDYVTTFDIRIKRPNAEPEIAPAPMHTIEHLVATFLRNDSEWKDRLVYWGPMGCLTGCYMITKGRPRPEDIYPIILKAFEFVRDFEGEIPGASPEKCGKYLMQDLPMAKWEAARYVDYLKSADKDLIFEYPKTEASQA